MSSEKDREKIEFKPLTSGLGFQPFSNGYPYAPPKKPRTTSGSGAEKAGRPQYVLPRMSPREEREPVKEPASPKKVSEPAQESFPQLDTQYGLGYLVKRVLSYLIDTITNTAICAVAMWAVMREYEIPTAQLLKPEFLFLASGFLLVFSWAVVAAQEVAFGTSFGKRMLGLNLEGGAGLLLIRAILFPIGVAFLGVGVLWALFHSGKKCWHDQIVGIQPEDYVRI